MVMLHKQHCFALVFRHRKRSVYAVRNPPSFSNVNKVRPKLQKCCVDTEDFGIVSKPGWVHISEVCKLGD